MDIGLLCIIVSASYQGIDGAIRRPEHFLWGDQQFCEYAHGRDECSFMRTGDFVY